MKHVNLMLDEEFVVFEKYKISPNELFFLQILLLSKEEDEQETIYRYFNLPEEVRGSITNLLKSLKEKGIILSSYNIPDKGQSFNPLDVPLNQNFQKVYFKASFDMFQELYEHYPVSTIVNGTEYKLRRISKKFDSLEDAGRFYGKAIRFNPERHRRIIELVDLGKDNNYQFTTLDSFLADNDWLNLEEMQDQGLLNHSMMRQL